MLETLLGRLGYCGAALTLATAGYGKTCMLSLHTQVSTESRTESLSKTCAVPNPSEHLIASCMPQQAQQAMKSRIILVRPFEPCGAAGSQEVKPGYPCPIYTGVSIRY